MKSLLLSYYGDDFTGSTDAMEAMTYAGLRTVLFLDPPTHEQLGRFPGIRAVGVAGVTRSMSPETMAATLLPIFERLRELGTPLIQYKVCSTFDSSPEVGSIGHVIELGLQVFRPRFVPIVAGAPILGRYCIFGNLFARSGLDTEPYRLDRHPTMRHHPITPMDESDLREHLARQTSKQVGLFDVLQLDLPESERQQRLEQILSSDPDAVLFDTLYEGHLPVLGGLIWRHASSASPLFAVASSGLEYALTAYWRSIGELPEAVEIRPTSPSDPVVVVSGSCSPVTARQIDWALDHGFTGIALDTEQLVDEQNSARAIQQVVERSVKRLRAGESVLLHTGMGPSDPRIPATLAQFRAMGYDELAIRLGTGKVIGEVLGSILEAILQDHPVPRVVVVGGDTSSYSARQLGVAALETISPTAPGAPLCRAHAPGRAIDGLEIVFKGGQVGRTDYFEHILRGGFS